VIFAFPWHRYRFLYYQICACRPRRQPVQGAQDAQFICRGRGRAKTFHGKKGQHQGASSLTLEAHEMVSVSGASESLPPHPGFPSLGVS